MFEKLRPRLIYVLKIGVSVAPMLGCMFFLYWMSTNEIWDATTPHRDLITGAVVASGMASAYFLLSWFVLKSK